jgi:hypothetical protein
MVFTPKLQSQRPAFFPSRRRNDRHSSLFVLQEPAQQEPVFYRRRSAPGDPFSDQLPAHSEPPGKLGLVGFAIAGARQRAGHPVGRFPRLGRVAPPLGLPLPLTSMTKPIKKSPESPIPAVPVVVSDRDCCDQSRTGPVARRLAPDLATGKHERPLRRET